MNTHPSSRERDRYAARVVLFLVSCLVIVLVGFGASCSALTHALNVPTLDDLEGARKDQAKVDRRQSELTADALTLQASPSDIVDGTNAAIENADASYRARTPPPTKDGAPDWAAIATIVAGAALSYATARNARSIKETDTWIEKDIEPHVKPARDAAAARA